MISTLFNNSVDNYTGDRELKRSLWKKIQNQYSSFTRFYHTLSHLESLALELLPYRDQFVNWDTVVFSLVYHDFFYNTLKKNNEERSAAYAKRQLAKTSFATSQAERCGMLILATKTHVKSDDDEINLFTDADLAVLGSAPENYRTYARQIRKEYFMYPDFMYLPGRRSVLEHFLKMKRIFKTDLFYDRYEAQARINLKVELDGCY